MLGHGIEVEKYEVVAQVYVGFSLSKAFTGLFNKWLIVHLMSFIKPITVVHRANEGKYTAKCLITSAIFAVP